MSTNFLTLDPSKTEFCFIGPPRQLYKLNSFTMHLCHSFICWLLTWVLSLITIFFGSTLVFCFLTIFPKYLRPTTSSYYGLSHYCFYSCYFSPVSFTSPSIFLLSKTSVLNLFSILVPFPSSKLRKYSKLDNSIQGSLYKLVIHLIHTSSFYSICISNLT